MLDAANHMQTELIKHLRFHSLKHFSLDSHNRPSLIMLYSLFLTLALDVLVMIITHESGVLVMIITHESGVPVMIITHESGVLVMICNVISAV